MRTAGLLVLALTLLAGCVSLATDRRAAAAAEAGVLELLRSYSTAVEEGRWEDVVVELLAPGTAHVRARVDQRFTRPDGTSFGFAVMLTAVVVESGTGWQFLKGHSSTLRPR